jgi:glycosyltransferase involved in cell wall biosynthesis
VAASYSIRAGLIHAGKIPAEGIDVIGEGVNPELYHPAIDGASLRHQWGIDPSAPLFGVIGSIRREKGLCAFVDAALELLRQVPRARFVLVGDGHGPYAERLRERIARAFSGSRPALFLAGFRIDIPRVIAALDALVVPSLAEGQTLVIPEAFACRKPVIASDVGGIPEIVTHGKTGLLVPPNKPRDLARAMRHLLDDPALARELAMAGHEFSKVNLCFGDRMKDRLRTYERAIGHRPTDSARGNTAQSLVSSAIS